MVSKPKVTIFCRLDSLCDPLRTFLKRDTTFIWETASRKAFCTKLRHSHLFRMLILLKLLNLTDEAHIDASSHQVAKKHASCKVRNPFSIHQEPFLTIKNIIASSRKKCLVLYVCVASLDSIITHLQEK